MPEIIAHRGGALLWPENSLTACRGAISLGVDQVQVDVRLSADGQVVALHDPTLDRTAEGSGRVDLLPWHELSKIPLRDAPGDFVPSLKAIIGEIRSGSASLRLELKGAPDNATRQKLVGRVIETLESVRFLDRVIITSFVPTDLVQVRALTSDPPLAWLLDAAATLAWTEVSSKTAREMGIATVGVRYDRITQELLRSLNAAELRLCCFGANDNFALEQSLSAEAHEVSTDRPDLGMLIKAAIAI